jgi:hypothetical protein
MRTTKTGLPGIRSAFALALGLAVLAAALFSAPDDEGPTSWEVGIRIGVRGRYAVTRDGTDYAGNFVYEAAWSGSMESDGPDYLLYHASLETLRWELAESACRDGARAALTEEDFPARPVLRINYVLGEQGRVRFFFVVESFPVPQNDSPEKYPLVLPCSRKEAAWSIVSGYDDGVSEGSNDVSLGVGEIGGKPVERKFRWTWKGYQPSSAPPPAGPLLNVHHAEVTLRITPRR